MTNDKFTPEQRVAIESTGKTIVSASAGSGKTTVMIEKIIRLIKSGHEVGEILAVTFTKKAAAQMKEKLSKALITAINDPATSPAQKKTLKTRLGEVPNADISTIHSFCARLIRSHFYLAGVDNNFHIISADDAEGLALKTQALNELMEEGYENGDDDFKTLTSAYFRKRKDDTLRKIILETYQSVRDKADYKRYLENSGAYDEETFNAVCEKLHASLKEECAYYRLLAEKELAYFTEKGDKAQLALAGELVDTFAEIEQTADYFTACALEKKKFSRNTLADKNSAEKRLHADRLTEIRLRLVKDIYKRFDETLSKSEELKNFLQSATTAKALGRYILRFEEKYAQLKRERSALDYNDLEHKSLELMQNPEVAEEMRGKYRYVFVDEYQDVNPVQERILSLVAGENLFLVGDVKQSIYGFRGSKSKFFVQKQEEFKNGAGNALALTRNFRSSDAVLNAVNKQFALAMTKESCNVDYLAESVMERGGMYALNDGRVQIHFLPEEEKSDESEPIREVYSVRKNADKKKEKFARMAKAIRAIVRQEYNSNIYDAEIKAYRKVKYADIAVLSRYKDGELSEVVAGLSEAGIPVNSSAMVNICEFAEIKTLIDVLSLIDNQKQDVPLCSALLSPMGNLTANELASVRLAYKKEAFFRDACALYAREKSDELAYKLNAFFNYLQSLRVYACVLNAGELLAKLLSDTRMEARLLSRENGGMAIRRIHRFMEETETPKPLSLHEFLDKLRDMQYKISFTENGGEDSVQVMTMHASKGLEYPVVIVDNMNAPFHGTRTEEVYVEENFGLAPYAFDCQTMTKKSTLLRRLHKIADTQSSIADELNLYYVALTRAKYALHMLFTEKPALTNVKYARSLADFTDFDVWSDFVTDETLFDVPKQPRSAFVFKPDEDLAREIMTAFSWEYPRVDLGNFPVKSSATSLLNARRRLQAENEPSDTLGLFGDEEERNRLDETSIEAGLAYHAFLEKFDFATLYDGFGAPISKERLQTVVEENLRTFASNDTDGRCGYLTAEKLTEILTNDVFYQLADKKLYKERQFLVSLPIKDAYESEDLKNVDEEILFQGAIDLLAVGENGAWIIDYKYSRKTAEELQKRYAPQLLLYKRAVAKIMRIPLENVRCSIVNIYLGFQTDLL